MWGKKRVSYTPRSLKRPCTYNKRRVSVVDKTSSNIKVVVRVRPSSNRDSGNRQVVQVIDENCLIFDPKENEGEFYVGGLKQLNRDMLKKRQKNIEYQFDSVFDQDSSNSEVFEGTTRDLIPSLLDGFNCSVFVYGATGAGKTYTMLGNHETPGIAFLTMVELYNKMRERDMEYKFDLKISYLEVYNETVKDLICPSGPLNLRDDGKDGIVISGIKMHSIENAEELFKMLEYGNRNRTQHPTDANAESSRSHAVFQVHLSISHKLSIETKISKLTMIDLAGSERGAATGGKGLRFSEGSNINKSLLALGNCVDALAEGHKHIPYRNSKLTRILKDSLGGNCKTVMIVNVAPSCLSYEETFNTLNYANRAKKINNKVRKNLLNVDLSITQYKRIIEELKQQNCALEKEVKALREGEKVSTDDKGFHSTETKVAIEKGRQVLHCLYELEGKYRKELFTYQIKKKTLDWRIYQKECVAERFQLFEYMLGNSKGQGQISNLKIQRKVYKDKVKSIQKLLKEKLSLREVALKDIEAKGILGELQKDIVHYTEKIKEESLECQVQYYKDLLLKQQHEVTNSNDIITRLCKTMDYYYRVLNGSGKITEPMKKQYLGLIQQLAGIKVVSWNDEPSEYTMLRKIMDLSLVSDESNSLTEFHNVQCIETSPPHRQERAPAPSPDGGNPVLLSPRDPYLTPSANLYRVPSTPSVGLENIAQYLSPQEDVAENISPCKQKYMNEQIQKCAPIASKCLVNSKFDKTFTFDTSVDENKTGKTIAHCLEIVPEEETDLRSSSKCPDNLDATFDSPQTIHKIEETDFMSSVKYQDDLNKTFISPHCTENGKEEEESDFKSCVKYPCDLNTTFDSPQAIENKTEEEPVIESSVKCPKNFNTFDSPCTVENGHSEVKCRSAEHTIDTPSLNTTFTKDSPSPVKHTTEGNEHTMTVPEKVGEKLQSNKTTSTPVLKTKSLAVRSNLPTIKSEILIPKPPSSAGNGSRLNRIGSGGSGSFARPLSVSSVKEKQIPPIPTSKFKIKPGTTFRIQYNVLGDKNKLISDGAKVPMLQNNGLDSGKKISPRYVSSRIHQKENSVTTLKRSSPNCSPRVYSGKIKCIKSTFDPQRSGSSTKIRM